MTTLPSQSYTTCLGIQINLSIRAYCTALHYWRNVFNAIVIIWSILYTVLHFKGLRENVFYSENYNFKKEEEKWLRVMKKSVKGGGYRLPIITPIHNDISSISMHFNKWYNNLLYVYINIWLLIFYENILDVMGASVHAPIQRNLFYGLTTIQSIYETRWTKHPPLPICWYKQFSPVTRFLDPLHVMLPRHSPDLRYV